MTSAAYLARYYAKEAVKAKTRMRAIEYAKLKWFRKKRKCKADLWAAFIAVCFLAPLASIVIGGWERWL